MKTKTLIVKSKLGGAIAIEVQKGDDLPVHLATFSQGNLQAAMFWSALGIAYDVSMPDQIDADLSAEHAAWIARTIKLYRDLSPVQRALVIGAGKTITEA